MGDLKPKGLLKLVDRSGTLTVDLDETEKELIVPSEMYLGFFKSGNLGYIDPRKVVSYYPFKIGKEFNGPPKLEVLIKFQDEWTEFGIAGTYAFFHEEKDEDFFVFDGPILEKDVLEKKINPKYIVEDNSGLFIPVTKERIEDEIKNGICRVNDGFREYFKKAEKLSHVAKLDFSKEIEEARRHDELKYLERYSSKENLENVLEQLEIYEPYRSDSEEDAESPALEILDEFCKAAPKITFPDGALKERAISLLKGYFAAALSSESNIIKDLQKRLDEETSYYRTQRDKIKLVLNKIQNI